MGDTAAFDWRGYESSDHRAALMRLAAESPHLAPLCIEVAHQHDCLEELKDAMGNFPVEMRQIVRSEFEAVATEREQSLGAWWRALRGWVTTIAAVLGGTAAIWTAFHH